jgi:osmotically inducible lipoprotein OsmB
MSLKETLKLALLRARYAAFGAAIGAALGGLFGRSSASTGGATGALVGAIVAEKRHSAGGWLDQVRPGDEAEDVTEEAGTVVDRVKEKREGLSTDD